MEQFREKLKRLHGEILSNNKYHKWGTLQISNNLFYVLFLFSVFVNPSSFSFLSSTLHLIIHFLNLPSHFLLFPSFSQVSTPLLSFLFTTFHFLSGRFASLHVAFLPSSCCYSVPAVVVAVAPGFIVVAVVIVVAMVVAVSCASGVVSRCHCCCCCCRCSYPYSYSFTYFSCLSLLPFPFLSQHDDLKTQNLQNVFTVVVRYFQSCGTFQFERADD